MDEKPPCIMKNIEEEAEGACIKEGLAKQGIVFLGSWINKRCSGMLLFFFTAGWSASALPGAFRFFGRPQRIRALCFAMVHLRARKQPETSIYHEQGAESALV